MAHRGYIAKVETDGTGRYIYIGHASYPSTTGAILLQHYQDPDKLDQLISMGSVPYIEPELHNIRPYYPSPETDWDHCKPAEFTGGTDTFFLTTYHPGPEWLYCFCPDGWLAARVTAENIPMDYFHRISTMPGEELDHWFHHNQEPHWVRWRNECRDRQQPQPLLSVVRAHVPDHPLAAT